MTVISLCFKRKYNFLVSFHFASSVVIVRRIIYFFLFLNNCTSRLGGYGDHMCGWTVSIFSCQSSWVFGILTFQGLPYIFLSNRITWVKDTQKYHIKIQKNFCIGQRRNLLSIANVKVSDVLRGLSPLSVCQSAVTNQRGVQQTVQQGRHSPGEPETGTLPSCVEGCGDWHLRSAVICEDVNGVSRHRMHLLGSQRKLLFLNLSPITSAHFLIIIGRYHNDVSIFQAIRTVGGK